MTRMKNRSANGQGRFLPLSVVLAAMTISGCGSYPQAQSRNRTLISSLRTALSTEQPEWLEHNVLEIEKRFQAGELTQEEYDAFQSIIAKAKAGDWDGAEKESVAFQRAQVRLGQ